MTDSKNLPTIFDKDGRYVRDIVFIVHSGEYLYLPPPPCFVVSDDYYIMDTRPHFCSMSEQEMLGQICYLGILTPKMRECIRMLNSMINSRGAHEYLSETARKEEMDIGDARDLLLNVVFDPDYEALSVDFDFPETGRHLSALREFDPMFLLDEQDFCGALFRVANEEDICHIGTVNQLCSMGMIDLGRTYKAYIDDCAFTTSDVSRESLERYLAPFQLRRDYNDIPLAIIRTIETCNTGRQGELNAFGFAFLPQRECTSNHVIVEKIDKARLPETNGFETLDSEYVDKMDFDEFPHSNLMDKLELPRDRWDPTKGVLYQTFENNVMELPDVVRLTEAAAYPRLKIYLMDC